MKRFAWLVACALVAGDEARAPALGILRGEVRIEINKEKRELLLFDGDTLVRRYPIGLGRRPTGHKQQEGDSATPEGTYFICVKNPHSRYYLSLGLNYPNAADAAAAVATGLITEADRKAIDDAERRRRRPPWDTKLGGEIFIHGRGAGSDWTAGCIALEDNAMKELYEVAQLGTPVVIRP